MKVALVHDWINNFSGATRVLFELHKMFPDAPIYTSTYNPKVVPAFKNADVRVSFLDKLPLLKYHHQALPILRQKAFEGFNFDDYDLVISFGTTDFEPTIALIL